MGRFWVSRVKPFYKFKKIRRIKSKLRAAIEKARAAESALKSERAALLSARSETERKNNQLMNMIHELKKINAEQQSLIYPALKMIQGHEDKLRHFENEARRSLLQ